MATITMAAQGCKSIVIDTAAVVVDDSNQGVRGTGGGGLRNQNFDAFMDTVRLAVSEIILAEKNQKRA